MNTKMDIASLSASYLAGEMNRKEINTFLSLIEKDEEMKKEFLRMKETWKKTGNNPFNDFTETGSAWNRLYERLNDEDLIPVRKITPQMINLAAGILLFIAISIPAYFYLNYQRSAADEGLTYSAINGNAAYDLPDGSRVFLKKGSRLRVSVSFEENRSVNLRGEGYFDVATDPENPFVIHTENALITVLGTSFNVKENSSSGDTEIFVESGKVQVKATKQKEELILTSGQYSKIDRKTIKVEKLMDPNYLSWITREFHFENEKLMNVFQVLENAYQVEIITTETEIRNKRLTSSYNKQSIDAILKTIGTAFNLKIEKEKNRYLVKYN